MASDRDSIEQQCPPNVGTVVRYSPDLLLVIDAAGTLCFVNEATAQLVGRRVDELVGTNALDLVHADDHAWVVEAQDEALHTGPGSRPLVAVRIVRADGTHRLLEIVSNNQLMNADVGGIVVSGRDVTDRDDMSSVHDVTRRRFEDSFEHAPSGRVHVSPEGCFIRVNKAMSAITGYPVEHLIGMRVADISHPDEIEENLDTIGRLLAGTLDSHLAERRLIRSDGGVCWVRRSLYVVRDADGKPAFLSADVTDITELREAEAARLRAENRTRALVDNTSEVIVILEPDGRWRWSNLAFTHILGYDHDQDPAPDGTVLDLIHPEDLANATEGIRRLIEGRADPNRVRTVRVRTRDGSWRRLAFHSRNLVDDPAVGGVVLFGHDVTDEHDARQRVAQLYEVFENSGEVVFLSDRAGRATYANKAARELFGLSEGSDLLADGAALLTPSSQERLRTEALPELRHAGTWGGQLTVFTTTGETFALAIRIHLHRDDDGAVVLVSGIAHDICDLVEAQKLLEHQATHDPLTGLSNRNLFQELGEQALARAERDGTTVAVLYLDLDHFKRVNDSRGHPIGDRLLQEIAQRLRDCVRRGDVIARFGGDEFVVLCEHPAGESEMAHLANRIIDALALPARIDEHEVRTGASIGIALGAGSRVTIDALLRDADAALYQAKDEGRGRAVRFGAPPAEQ